MKSRASSHIVVFRLFLFMIAVLVPVFMWSSVSLAGDHASPMQLAVVKCMTTGTICGDGKADAGEECDRNDLRGEDCASKGYPSGGELRCSDTCTFDTLGCISSKCGNGIQEEGEECDGKDENCFWIPSDKDYFGGMAKCVDCKYDVSDCYECGNGRLEGSEQCEGDNLMGKTCADFGGTGGVLKCNPNDCNFDRSECEGACGNGVLDPGEECDWLRRGFDGKNCLTYGGYPDGPYRSLTCTDDCKIDVSRCCDDLYFAKGCTGELACDKVGYPIDECHPNPVTHHCDCTVDQVASEARCEEYPGCTWNPDASVCEGTIDCADLDVQSIEDNSAVRGCSCTTVIHGCFGPDGNALITY